MDPKVRINVWTLLEHQVQIKKRNFEQGRGEGVAERRPDRQSQTADNVGPPVGLDGDVRGLLLNEEAREIFDKLSFTL